MTIDPLLTPAEVAACLGVSVEEVWRLTRSGVLPAIKISGSRYGRTRIRPEDLREYLQGRRG
jgi:excisionase family DNA binding protein